MLRFLKRKKFNRRKEDTDFANLCYGEDNFFPFVFTCMYTKSVNREMWVKQRTTDIYRDVMLLHVYSFAAIHAHKLFSIESY